MSRAAKLELASRIDPIAEKDPCRRSCLARDQTVFRYMPVTLSGAGMGCAVKDDAKASVQDARVANADAHRFPAARL